MLHEAARSLSFSPVACRGTCGRPKSVARAVISFTVLGAIFYVGIVIAGTSSYDCPFQTPASTALRALMQKDDPEIISEYITAQGHIVCLHLLEGCRGKPAALGDFLSSISGGRVFLTAGRFDTGQDAEAVDFTHSCVYGIAPNIYTMFLDKRLRAAQYRSRMIARLIHLV
jgi:hypothetical protein